MSQAYCSLPTPCWRYDEREKGDCDDLYFSQHAKPRHGTHARSPLILSLLFPTSKILSIHTAICPSRAGMYARPGIACTRADPSTSYCWIFAQFATDWKNNPASTHVERHTEISVGVERMQDQKQQRGGPAQEPNLQISQVGDNADAHVS